MSENTNPKAKYTQSTLVIGETNTVHKESAYIWSVDNGSRYVVDLDLVDGDECFNFSMSVEQAEKFKAALEKSIKTARAGNKKFYDGGAADI